MDIFTRTFFYPTLTNHLINKFGFNLEQSSVFFIVHIISYIVVLQNINLITTKYGYKLSILFGLLMNIIGSPLLSPLFILPQSYIFIVLGLLLLGIPAALINVSAMCDLVDHLALKKINTDENTINDVSAAIYITAINFGETLGPIFGGYVTERSSFENSCMLTSLINVIVFLFFYIRNNHSFRQY
jgi:fucose permease